MKILDPRLFTAQLPQDIILFASTSGGSTKMYCNHFHDECFVLADGLSTVPHAEEAARLAGETALWGYKQIRLRHTYWADKISLIRRIFRTTNLTIWQKHREPGFGDGLATSLLVAIIGPRAVWIGSVGDSSAFLFRDGKLMRLTREDTNTQGKITKALGFVRVGLKAQNVHQRFMASDVLFLVSGGITHTLDTGELADIGKDAGDCEERLLKAARAVIERAQKRTSTEQVMVCLIKRVALPR